MNSESDSSHLITADKRLDADGKPLAFLLTNRNEQIALEPGKTWAQLDTHKWVTRGLIAEPTGFHVLAHGAVEIHGEQIELDDPKAVVRLEEMINQHLGASPPKPSRPAILAQTAAPQPSGSNKIQFKVRLDRLGHLMVTSIRAGEKTETGIRGLESLVRNGLMLEPKNIHIDPLLAYVEIDGVRFDSDPAGAESLEHRLNRFYAPVLKSDGRTAIEIKANSAAASGFDIHFNTFRAGARFEIKGHLCQEHLDTLQDATKCELLRPGVILRLSPPHLIVRRRRPDGGEERIPDLPDQNYLRITAAELQRILNHPAIRRGADAADPQTAAAADRESSEIIEVRLARNPQNKSLLGMEIVSASGSHASAFTHHNVAELQHAGAFRPNLHVILSLDHRTLSILDNETHHEEHLLVEPSSPDADLRKAAQMLTAALKPPAHRAVEQKPIEERQTAKEAEPAVEEAACDRKPEFPAEEVCGGPHKPEPEPILPEPPPFIPPVPASEPPLPARPPVVPAVPAPASPAPETSPEIRALFRESDGVRINIEIFKRLESCLGLPTQRIRLSLDRVFHHRPFEIISFTHSDISDIQEIHSEEFAGFYLSHIDERRVILDYAWHGKRIEWGPQKCWVRPGTKADPEEFGNRALLGMALVGSNRFAFVVTHDFKRWIAPREKHYQEAGASFVTIDDLAASPEDFPLVWPVPQD